jgi:hypothetical protein
MKNALAVTVGLLLRRHIVPNSRFADNTSSGFAIGKTLRVSWMLSGFRLARLPYAIGLRSHGVESYICFDDKLSLTHER